MKLRDFGTLAMLQGEPVVGIMFLRPGHLDAQFTIDTIQTVLNVDPELTAPFILVAKRQANSVTIRIRHLGP